MKSDDYKNVASFLKDIEDFIERIGNPNPNKYYYNYMTPDAKELVVKILEEWAVAQKKELTNKEYNNAFATYLLAMAQLLKAKNEIIPNDNKRNKI